MLITSSHRLNKLSLDDLNRITTTDLLKSSFSLSEIDLITKIISV